jgi:hypothetical protein
MRAVTQLNPNNPDFEPFLFATAGEDSSGHGVSLLSILARQNLDPWSEAADLAALTGDGAVTRLGHLLSRSLDMPALRLDPDTTARRLARLLPGRPPARDPANATGPRPLRLSKAAILSLLGVAVLLVQMMLWATPGAGG